MIDQPRMIRHQWIDWRLVIHASQETTYPAAIMIVAA
jgi:hypothetical protein